jgi:hypothetical protein
MERTEGAIKSLYHRTLIALRDDIVMQQSTRVDPDPKKRSKKG